MAEQNVQENKSTTTTTERTPFKIEIQEHAPFNSIAETMYLTSNDLCLLTNELFKGVFCDCEGSTFEAGKGMDPFMSIAFNHGEYDSGRKGIERVGGDKGSDVISRIRYRDSFIANGDRYSLTDDGKDVFKDLLNPRAYNNGNPNWKNIVGEFQEGQTMTGQRIQYTKVLYLDPAKLCELLFGDTIGGDRVGYNVNILASMNFTPIPNVSNSNFLLQVTRVSAKEIKSIYEKFGFGSFSSIVR